MQATLTLKINAQESKCVRCDYAITNPICTDCLSSKMMVVLGESDFNLAAQLTSGTYNFASGKTTNCLKCHKGMNVCAHCFSFDILDYLEEKHPELAEEFKARFDFDLRKPEISF